MMKLQHHLRTIVLVIGFLLASGKGSHAQWQTVTYTLKGGWNAIYLHGDATHATPDALFSAGDALNIEEVWRWNPNPTQVQFTTSPQLPTPGTPEWSVWLRGQPGQSTLDSLMGNRAYLVKCTGTESSSYSVAITQRPLPPGASWMRNGANLLGFPSRDNGGSYPSITAYFATFPAATSANARIYKYAGGELGPTNPVQVFSAAQERVDRNQAYWFESAVVGNFYGPLEITTSNPQGLDYGRTGSLITVRMRNRSAATVTVTIAPVASAAAPSGQAEITGSVPLNLRASDGTETALGGGITQVVGPQTAVEMDLVVDRVAMSTASGAFYASLLRFRDSGNLMEVLVPARAQVATMAGLWVGDALVTHVASKAAASPGATTPRALPLRFIMHVDDSGTARLLSQVFMGTLADAGNPVGLCTLESGLKQDARADASRMSAAHLPLDAVITAGSGEVALGSTLLRTVTIPYNDPTNPFVHQYHPDHDNRERQAAGTFAILPAGVESFTISRSLTFEFTASPPAGTSAIGWGSAVIGGNYSETLAGLHKEAITVSGTFTLRRASENGAITVN